MRIHRHRRQPTASTLSHILHDYLRASEKCYFSQVNVLLQSHATSNECSIGYQGLLKYHCPPNSCSCIITKQQLVRLCKMLICLLVLKIQPGVLLRSSKYPSDSQLWQHTEQKAAVYRRRIGLLENVENCGGDPEQADTACLLPN